MSIIAVDYGTIQGGGENVFMQYYASINGGDTIDPGFVPTKIIFITTFYNKARGVVYNADEESDKFWQYVDSSRNQYSFNQGQCGIKSIDPTTGVITLDHTLAYNNMYIIATS